MDHPGSPGARLTGGKRRRLKLTHQNGKDNVASPCPEYSPPFQPGKRMTDSRDKTRELLKTRLQKHSIPARHQPNVEKQQQALLLWNGDSNDKPARGE
jgi:hypothetical protein